MAGVRGARPNAWCEPGFIPGSMLVITLSGGRARAPAAGAGTLRDPGLTPEQW